MMISDLKRTAMISDTEYAALNTAFGGRLYQVADEPLVPGDLLVIVGDERRYVEFNLSPADMDLLHRDPDEFRCRRVDPILASLGL